MHYFLPATGPCSAHAGLNDSRQRLNGGARTFVLDPFPNLQLSQNYPDSSVKPAVAKARAPVLRGIDALAPRDGRGVHASEVRDSGSLWLTILISPG